MTTVFPYAKNWVVMEVSREEEFAPVKNAPGRGSVDSPDTAREMISSLCKRWITESGGTLTIPNISKDDDNCSENYNLYCCEISPLLSYEGEGLETFNGLNIQLPCYLN